MERYAKRAFGWAMLLFGVPLPVKGSNWFCFDCRAEFKPTTKKRDSGT